MTTYKGDFRKSCKILETSIFCRGIFKTKLKLALLNTSCSKLFSSEFLLSLVLWKPLIVITGPLGKRIRKRHPYTPPPLFFNAQEFLLESHLLDLICQLKIPS